MASKVVLDAVAAAKQYLSYKYDENDLSAIYMDIGVISGVNKKDFVQQEAGERIGYNDLQKKLANLNEKETDRKEKGVYYTPADVVRFIITNSINAINAISCNKKCTSRE